MTMHIPRQRKTIEPAEWQALLATGTDAKILAALLDAARHNPGNTSYAHTLLLEGSAYRQRLVPLMTLHAHTQPNEEALLEGLLRATLTWALREGQGETLAWLVAQQHLSMARRMTTLMGALVWLEPGMVDGGSSAVGRVLDWLVAPGELAQGATQETMTVQRVSARSALGLAMGLYDQLTADAWGQVPALFGALIERLLDHGAPWQGVPHCHGASWGLVQVHPRVQADRLMGMARAARAGGRLDKTPLAEQHRL
jgi:hypothetical protein